MMFILEDNSRCIGKFRIMRVKSRDFALVRYIRALRFDFIESLLFRKSPHLLR